MATPRIATVTANEATLQILRNSLVDKDGVALNGNLDRATYVQVNKFLELAGAKWNKKTKRHLFVSPAAYQKLVELLQTGSVVDEKKSYQAFYTPASLAKQVVAATDIQPGMDVLEPSAGEGALAIEARAVGGSVWCVDSNCSASRQLGRLGFISKDADFLTLRPTTFYPSGFDRVVMNPPFTRDQDVQHVCHAFEFLKPGGILTAIISKRFTFAQSAPIVEFRTLLKNHGEVLFGVPAGTFSESGTAVETSVIQLRRPL